MLSMSKLSLLLILIISGLLSGCQPSATAAIDNVNFDASPGESRRYQVYSAMSEQLDSIDQVPSALSRGRALVEYRVASRDELTLNFEVTPLMLEYTSDHLQASISTRSPHQDTFKLANFFRQGFQFSINLSDSELVSVSSNTLPQQHPRINADILTAQAKNMILIPPTVVNAHMPLALPPEANRHAWPQANIKLIAQTDDELTWSYEITTDRQDYPNLYAEYRVDRHSGWLNAMVMITRTQLSPLDNSVIIGRFAMLPETSQDGSYFWESSAGHLLESSPLDLPLPTITPTPVTPSSPALVTTYGIFHPSKQDAELELTLFGGFQDNFSPLTLRIKQLTAQLVSGEEQQLNYTHQLFDTRVNAEFARHSLTASLEHPAPAMTALDATLEFTPYQTTSVAKPISEWLKHGVSQDGIEISVSVLDAKQHSYAINISHDPHTKVRLDLSELQGQFRIKPIPLTDIPQWLSDSDAIGIDFIRYLGWIRNRIELNLTETPAQLTMNLLSPDVAQTDTATIRFVTEQEYVAKLTPPPLTIDIVDYATRADSSFFANPPSQTPPATLDELSPYSASGHDLSLWLSPMMAQVCRVEINQGFTEAGNPVVFAENQSELVAQDVRWDLMTDDGIRRFFYDKSVTFTIHCQGTTDIIHRQLAANDTPWLIDVSPWLTAERLHADARQFINAIKVLDQHGNQLAIRGPQQEADFTPSPLSRFLVDGKYLSVSGFAAAVQYTDIKGEPISREFSFDFKPLPYGTTP
ncbi:hypothetical protein [Shewanella sp. NIFS-20-20]|uniref:hypothetical protein n=1 Tax=Shewanella sp. NIFS-20-20 TaxID=2853806 RepID=UPI001C45B23D|nr:hypothetical protein [Shewanella sp. NIFS-20-20]MBV7314481.1 hypothetical protein [Shewanella sp. NIFS-20-20]